MHDTGFAPNPFWGYCTLAVCTPNHMGVQPKGDEFWIAGFSGKKYENKLIYAMKVDEFVDFDNYYNDPRFSKKKPNIRGTSKEIPGDNIYYRDSSNRWQQHKTIYHTEVDEITKDLKYPKVFISTHFFYFGEKAVSTKRFSEFILRRQGVKMDHDPRKVKMFIDWLHNDFSTGIIGFPRDLRHRNSC